MAQWRCRIDGREQGPFSDEELRAKALAGEIEPTDEIYNPASKRWEQAGRLRGLFAPPPVATRPLDDQGLPPAVALVADDAGLFVRIAGSFAYTRMAPWSGTVLLSPTAFYLAKGQRVSMGHGFGALGVILAAAIEKDDDVRSCGLSQLPEPVREQLTSWTKRDFDVIVLPKCAVHRVITSWTGALSVYCGDDRFDIHSRFFRAAKARRFLREHGWTLNQEVEVTHEPVHGVAVGRSDADPAPPKPSPLRALAYAAVVLIAVVAGLLAKSKHSPSPARGSEERAYPQPDPYGTFKPSPVHHR